MTLTMAIQAVACMITMLPTAGLPLSSVAFKACKSTLQKRRVIVRLLVQLLHPPAMHCVTVRGPLVLLHPLHRHLLRLARAASS